MAGSKTYFRCIILSPKNLVFEKEITSVFIHSDKGEFELLSYHYPLVAILVEDEIVIDQMYRIPVRSGIVRFYANECTILVEETPETMMVAKEILQLAKT
jgi:F0F1-type ATP synthase epsilon subunit